VRPGTRVLVIEDDDYTARLLKLQLEHHDFKVRCEYDGPSGLKAAVQFDPEVIVLDIMLPGLDGVEVFFRHEAAHGFGGTTGEVIHHLKVSRELGIWFHRTFADPGFAPGASGSANRGWERGWTASSISAAA
jgi:hypothetical protein